MRPRGDAGGGESRCRPPAPARSVWPTRRPRRVSRGRLAPPSHRPADPRRAGPRAHRWWAAGPPSRRKGPRGRRTRPPDARGGRSRRPAGVRPEAGTSTRRRADARTAPPDRLRSCGRLARRRAAAAPRPRVGPVVDGLPALAEFERAERVDHDGELVEELGADGAFVGAGLGAVGVAAGVQADRALPDAGAFAGFVVA